MFLKRSENNIILPKLMLVSLLLSIFVFVAASPAMAFKVFPDRLVIKQDQRTAMIIVKNDLRCRRRMRLAGRVWR